MRFGNPAYGLNTWIIVEHDTAAAIDLKINETRGDDLTSKIDDVSAAENLIAGTKGHKLHLAPNRTAAPLVKFDRRQKTAAALKTMACVIRFP
jgi:hypothetical protein